MVQFSDYANGFADPNGGIQQRVYSYFNQLPVAVAVYLGTDQVYDYVNEAYCQLIGKPPAAVLGKPLFAVFPELRGTNIDYIHQRVMRSGVAEQIEENPVSFLQNGKLYHGFFNTRFQPLKDDAGIITGLLVSGYDITETVAARIRNELREAHLKKAKEHLEAGIHTGKVGIWYWEAQTDTLTWSTEQYELFGLSPETPIKHVADFRHFVHPDDLDKMYESASPATGGTSYEYKFRIRRSDGATRWLQARSQTHFDEAGVLLSITGVNIDITDQEEMRLQLEASERRFRSLADNSPDVITRHGKNYRYLYASPKIENYTGISASEFLGRNYRDLGLPEELCCFFDESLAHVFRTGKPHQVSYGVPGDTRHIYSRMAPEFDENGEVDSVLIISTDITEMKDAELQQRKLATQLQLATDSANVGTWWYDVHTGALEWSDLHKTMWGYPETKAKMVFADWHERIHPADFAGVMQQLTAAELERNRYDATYRIYTNGAKTLRWIRSVGQYQYDETGRPVTLTGVSIDITDQKVVEEELKAQKEHFSLAIEGASLGTYEFNPETGMVLWSDTTREIFGVPPDVAVTYPLFLEAIHPADRERVNTATLGSMEQGHSGLFDEEYRVINYKDGLLRWARSKGRVFFDGDGKALRFIGVVQDITRYKEIQLELNEGRERLQVALNASNTGTFRWNIRTNDLSWDENLDRLFGLPSDARVQSLDQFLACVHPDDRDRISKACARCATQSSDFDEEFRVVWPDGSIHWLDDKGKTFLGQDGKPDFMTGACVSITDRKRFEQVLAANEQRFRTLGNSIAQLAWMADASGEIYWYNDRWYDYTHSDLTSMQGWGWQTVHHPDHVDRVVSFVANAWQKNEPWELTFPLRRHDGEYRWFLTRAYPVCDEAGNIVQWIGTNTDIHEHLETQRALKKSEEQLRILADFLPQIIWTTNAQGSIVYINKRWTDYTGEPADVTPVSDWLKVVHPEDREMVRESWLASIQTGTYYEKEYRIRSKYGIYRWYLSRALPLLDESGSIMQWFGSSTDIHDRKAMAEQLEQQVQERTRALQRSNEDLQQFAHVASHDLKEPVRKVKTFASALELELGGAISPQGQLYLSKVNSAADRMFAMINGVLHYSAMNALSVQFERVDLSVVLSEIIHDLEVLISEKNARVEIGQLPVVQGVPLLLYQLFYNLLNNSLKFSRSSEQTLIGVTARLIQGQDRNMYCITVEDNGIGFDQQFAESIFSTFTRLHSKDAFEGTGLGLSLCKKIVERHGGRICAQGSEGKGARFEIELPAQ